MHVIHHKTRTLYAVVAVAQNSEIDMRHVVYKNAATGAVWVRPYEMFVDGRFSIAATSLPTPEPLGKPLEIDKLKEDLCATRK